MNAKVLPQQDISTKLIEHWEQVCGKMVALAEEFPAQNFETKPAEGARNVAEVLRHTAFWNNYVADKASGKKADDTTNELPRQKFSSKSEIIGALQRSASDATAALRSSAPFNTELAEMVVSFLEHNSEHYGQLAAYARLLGIVPPASRG